MGEARAFHSSVQHMLLIDTRPEPGWFDSHPPLAERIRRIYGRPMAAIASQGDEGVVRPDAIF